MKRAPLVGKIFEHVGFQKSPGFPGKSQHARQCRALENLSLGLQPPVGAEQISTLVKFHSFRIKKRQCSTWHGEVGSRSTWITLLSAYSKNKRKKERYSEDFGMSRRTNMYARRKDFPLTSSNPWRISKTVASRNQTRRRN